MVTLARCFWKKIQNVSAFLAGHESFAAAEGAIGIAEKANKVRQKPLTCYLKRSWKRCCADYFPYQRIHIC